jgi:hypothetical protein
MKNVVKIDLRKFNQAKLKEACDKYGINYASMLNNKSKGFATIWIDIKLQYIVAYTTKNNTEVKYTDLFTDQLVSMKEVEMIKQPREITLDGILEKISKYGIDSLKLDEKDFLDNLSK